MHGLRNHERVRVEQNPTKRRGTNFETERRTSERNDIFYRSRMKMRPKIWYEAFEN